MKKLWSRLSITKKLFILTASIFSLFLTLLFICQLFFFKTYYTYTIRRGLLQVVNGFTEEYAGLSDDTKINELIVREANDSNAYITVMGERNEILHMVSYEMSVDTESNGVIRLALDNAIRDQTFLDLELKEGDSVTVSFFYAPQGRRSRLIIPQTITSGSQTWEMPPQPIPGLDSRPVSDKDLGADRTIGVNITGRISSITLPTQQSSQLNIQRNEAFGAAMDWMFRVNNGLQITAQAPVHYVYQSPDSGNTYCVFAKKINNRGNPEIVFALTPMRPVNEAMAVIQDFLWVWLVLTVLMAVVVAVLFSRTITRPILRITDVTRKMRSLDFSQKCPVSAQDEIGTLALNVNQMSEKLDSAINALRQANETLIEDIEHERKLEQQRKEFVATVSHELKTPLAIIRAYSEGLIDGVSVEKQSRYLQVIVDETAKMDALILSMLENSKLETGAQKPDMKTYDLSDFVHKIVKRMRQAFEREGLTFTEQIEQAPLQRTFDKVLLEQAVMNFLTNALHHTKPGGTVTVTVSSEVVSVENEGMPIPADELDKVWDRFYKIDKSRARSHNTGSGLGLTIAKNILLLHNAEYGVENTQTGVRFWFRLPPK